MNLAKSHVPAAALTLTLALTLAFAGPAPAAPEPRIEVGVGAILLTVPDYRGSDRYDVQAYPIPFVVYRSQNVQLSREGLRARLFTRDALTASMSAALNLTGRADNPDRAGMPRLSPTLEIGPSLDWDLGAGPGWRTRARLPVRGAVAVRGFKWVGATALPHLRLDYDQDLGGSHVYWLGSAGVLWASSEYHDYFYGVDPAYAAPACGCAAAGLVRPAYRASAGYSGARATLSATWHKDRWRLGAFGSFDSLDGAAFEDSPLVKVAHSGTAGVYMSYEFYQSGRDRPVDADLP